jgi:hypothetical protein
MAVDAETRQRISNLERQVKALMKHTGMPEPAVTSELSEKAKAAIRDAKPMEAVKLIRQELQCDLDEAKRIYEAAF